MNEEAILRLKKHLKETAEKKFPGDKERQNAYIFGTLNRIKNR